MPPSPRAIPREPQSSPDEAVRGEPDGGREIQKTFVLKRRLLLRLIPSSSPSRRPVWIENNETRRHSVIARSEPIHGDLSQALPYLIPHKRRQRAPQLVVGRQETGYWAFTLRKKVRLHGLAAICRSTPYPCPPVGKQIDLSPYRFELIKTA